MGPVAPREPKTGPFKINELVKKRALSSSGASFDTDSRPRTKREGEFRIFATIYGGRLGMETATYRGSKSKIFKTQNRAKLLGGGCYGVICW